MPFKGACEYKNSSVQPTVNPEHALSKNHTKVAE
jgi:hypothetical protein